MIPTVTNPEMIPKIRKNLFVRTYLSLLFSDLLSHRFDAQITARQQWLRSKLLRIAIAVIDLISDFSVFRSPISVCIAFDAAITARQQWWRSKMARIAIAVIDLVGLFVIGRVCALLFDHVGC